MVLKCQFSRYSFIIYHLKLIFYTLNKHDVQTFFHSITTQKIIKRFLTYSHFTAPFWCFTVR